MIGPGWRSLLCARIWEPLPLLRRPPLASCDPCTKRHVVHRAFSGATSRSSPCRKDTLKIPWQLGDVSAPDRAATAPTTSVHRYQTCARSSQSSHIQVSNVVSLRTLHRPSSSRPFRGPGTIPTRTFSTSTLLTILTPPAVFISLVLTLWAYKCLMMILFQNKIIYMPSVPPFSRSEKLEDYARECGRVVWREERLEAGDGVELGVAVGEVGVGGAGGKRSQMARRASDGHDSEVEGKERKKHLILLYFQGNASSLPPRTPLLSSVMRETLAQHQSDADTQLLSITLLALSYRGFWTSAGRPSQAGIELDAAAALAYARSLSVKLTEAGEDVHLVLWGQSIGCGVATNALANALSSAQHERKSEKAAEASRLEQRIDALILETPFLSIRHMLTSLYPQKWLPYRYLWPFLWNWWDSEGALRRVSECYSHFEELGKHGSKPKVLILNAEKDEVVPADQGREMVRLVQELGYESKSVDVQGALHHEVCVKSDGRKRIAGFLCEITKSKGSDTADLDCFGG